MKIAILKKYIMIWTHLQKMIQMQLIWLTRNIHGVNMRNLPEIDEMYLSLEYQNLNFQKEVIKEFTEGNLLESKFLKCISKGF